MSAFTTRSVLAVVAAGVILFAMVLSRRDDGPRASWAMTVGFAIVALWTALGVSWAYEFPEESVVSWRSWTSLLLVSAAFTLYYGVKASQGEGLRG